MRTALFSAALGALLVLGSGSLEALAAAPSASARPGARPTHTAGDPLANQPLRFERNDGQTDARVKYLSRGRGYTLFLTPAEAVLALRKPTGRTGGHGRTPDVDVETLRVKLLGANPDPRIVAENELAARANYFVGNDPTRWRTNVPTYGRVGYRDVYPGIDLVYYGMHERQLEYDFVLAPGADPHAIALAFDGARRLALDGAGDLVVTLADGGTVIHKAPVIYQERDGRRETVEGRCVLRDGDRVGFELAAYDRARPLFIDPGLVYATYLGGSADDEAFAIAVDASGAAYVTGVTGSADFPTTAGAVVTTPPGGGNMFVTKVAADGSGVVYSTYLGGDAFDNFEQGRGIAVDAAGSAYVTGDCGQGGTFPTTAGAFQRTFGGGYEDAFVTKLSPDGSALVYSTLLGGGGDDEAHAIAVDTSGAAYVTGQTSSNNLICTGIALPIACCTGFHAGTCNYPTTAGAVQTANAAATVGTNVFVTKLKADGSGLAYSTYLGGSHGEKAVGIAIDATGHAYVAGNSTSADFPTTAGAFLTTKPSDFSIWDTPFVTKLAADGSALVYSTYVGGSQQDDAAGIAVDAAGDAHVTGTTTSNDFPTTPGAFRTTNHSEDVIDAFVTKMNAAGTGLLYSTYLGGAAGNETGFGIAIGDVGHAYVTGITTSGDFPVTADAYQTGLRSAGQNAFVTKLRVDGGGLVYSTYLSGNGGGDFGYAIAVDGAGDAYVTGRSSGGFPITDGAFQSSEKGSTDAFVAKLSIPSGVDPTTTTITSTTVFSTTSPTATTTLAGVPTTTSTLPCTTARCTLSALPQSPTCVGQMVPQSVTGKLAKAESLVDQAASSPAKQAKKLFKRAKKALKQAATKAKRAAKGKHPQLSPACANALQSGLARVLAGLGV